MHIKHFTVCTEACPRYRYVREYVTIFSKKANILIKHCAINDTFSASEFSKVHIYIVTENETDLIRREHMINNDSKCACIEIETFRCANPETFKNSVKEQLFICVCSFEEFNRNNTIIWQYVGQALLLIHDQPDFSETHNVKSFHDTIVVITHRSRFAAELDIILERMMFKYLYPKVLILKSFLLLRPASVIIDSINKSIKHKLSAKLQQKNQTEKNETVQLYRAWHEARLEVVTTIIHEAYGKENTEVIRQILKLPSSKRFTEEHRALTICEHILPFLLNRLSGCGRMSLHDISHFKDFFDQKRAKATRLKTLPDHLLKQVGDMQIASDVKRYADEILATFTENINCVHNNRDQIEQLYFECAAMYSRSKVPESERPIPPQQLFYRLEQSVAKEILNVKGVTGCGYRFTILDIYLNDTLTEEDKIRSKMELKYIISQYQIDRFVFRNESNCIQFCLNAGSAIFADGFSARATLGGFAKRGHNKTLCLLLSRHFASAGTCISAELNNRSRELVAKVLPQKQLTGHHFVVDITVADVIQHFQKRCSTQFRDLYGNPKSSRLVQFEENELEKMNGLPVHIWGAASSPGKGIIICPEYFVPMGKDGISKFVKIENLCQGEDFAKPGDSGSIVCADDIEGNCVHVISMLIGSAGVGNRAQTNQYLSFRMKDGLSQLREEYDEDFKLC